MKLIIDSGTTNFQIAKNIKNNNCNNLTILTHDIKIAYELCSNKKLRIILLGGIVNNEQYSTYKYFSENILSNTRSDKLFLAVDGASFENGFSCVSVEDGELKKLMIKSSKKIIVILDSTKFNKVTFFKICDLGNIDMLITDDQIPKEYVSYFEGKNIEVEIVKK